MRPWQALFAAAALSYIAVAAALLARPPRFAMHLGISGEGAPFVIAYIAVLLAAFGIGFAIAATAPHRYRGVVWAGMLAKLGLVGVATAHFAAEVIPFRYYVLATGEVLFAALFGVFLWRTRR